MMKIIYNCSRAIQKSKKLLTQMRNNKFYMDDPRISQRQEAHRIVEQLYFYREDKLTQQIKEEETYFNQLLEKPQDQVDFSKFSTVKEMLDFYDAKQFNFTRQQYTDFFFQLRLCIKNAEQIQLRKLNYHKKLAAKYRVQYNKEYEPPIYVFLSVEQILKEPVFNALLEDFVRECEVIDFLVVRKGLMEFFQQKIYILDYFILQRLWEENEYQLETINLISLLAKDVAEGKIPLDVQEQILALFEGRHKAEQNLQQVLEQFLLEKLSKIQFQKLDNQRLTDFIYAYNWNRTLDALPSFQTELVAVLKERVATLTVSQTLKILKILILLKVGDDQIFSYLMWNTIRLKSQIKSSDLFNLIFVLFKFQQNKLCISDRRISQEFIQMKDFMVFPELFQVAMIYLNQFAFHQLAKLLKIAYYNYAEQSQTNAIIANLFKQKEMKEPFQIDEKIELFYIATQIGNMELDVKELLRQKIMLLTKNSVAGYFEVMKTKAKSEINVELPYYKKELQYLIKLTWTCILQKSQDFENINYLILKINELTSLQTIMRVEKKLHKLISQINQYISLFGKNNFPQKIDFEQIKNNPSIISFKEKFARPKKISTSLFSQEIQYFCGKYKSDIEKNVTFKDMFVDIVYTNPKTGNKAFIILNGPNDYTMSVTGEMIPHNQIAFQEELLQTSKIPVVRINLPELVRSKQTCYFEETLKDILEGGNDEYEKHFKLIENFRDMLKNNFNYISTFEYSVDEEAEEAEEAEEIVYKDDHYELSDEDK